MARYIPERDDVMGRMERDQRDARLGGCPEPEILSYIVDTYHPSWRELRRIRNPMGSFLYVDRNERVLVSDKTTRLEVNLFNRKQRLRQEIGATKEDWQTVYGVKRVFVYVLEIAKAVVIEARTRNQRMIDGATEKDKRLQDRLRNPRRYRREADAINATVLAAIRRGRRGGSGGGAGIK